MGSPDVPPAWLSPQLLEVLANLNGLAASPLLPVPSHPSMLQLALLPHSHSGLAPLLPAPADGTSSGILLHSTCLKSLVSCSYCCKQAAAGHTTDRLLYHSQGVGDYSFSLETLWAPSALRTLSLHHFSSSSCPSKLQAVKAITPQPRLLELQGFSVHIPQVLMAAV